MKARPARKNTPIRADLHGIVRDRIVRGELAPGARIKESALAEELGTSRTPLREALISLAHEGLIHSEFAHGFSVEPLSGREVRENYPVLWTLEGLALRASGNAVYDVLIEISKINAALAKSTKPEDRISLDTAWHEKLGLSKQTVTIGANETKEITISHKIPATDQPGVANRSAVLHTDCPKHPRLTLTLSVTVD